VAERISRLHNAKRSQLKQRVNADFPTHEHSQKVKSHVPLE
jgi:hypothetical protein